MLYDLLFEDDHEKKIAKNGDHCWETLNAISRILQLKDLELNYLWFQDEATSQIDLNVWRLWMTLKVS